jgi:hypothetical protein
MTDNLKRCPFCGKEGCYTNSDGSAVADNEPTLWAACADPSCMGYHIFFPIDQWQSRPIEDEWERAFTNLQIAGEQLIEMLEYYDRCKHEDTQGWIEEFRKRSKR